MGFDFETSSSSDSDNGELWIYNLSNEKRSLFNTEIIGFTTLEIYSGYIEKGSVSKIFSGYVVEAKHIPEDGSIKTVLTFNETFNDDVNPDDALSFKKGTTVKEVVETKIKKSQEDKKNKGYHTPIMVFFTVISGGLPFYLSTKNVFDKGTGSEFNEYVRSSGGLVVQRNGNKHVVDKEEYEKGIVFQTSHIVNQNTGMIGVPEQVTEVENVDSVLDLESAEDAALLKKSGIVPQIKPTSTNSKAGYQVTTLMNTSISVGDSVVLTSEVLKIKNLRLRCDRIHYSGSNHENDFYTTLCCFPPKES
jgi:hypothetical protein